MRVITSLTCRIPQKVRSGTPPESFNIFSTAFDETAEAFLNTLRLRTRDNKDGPLKPTAIILDMTNTPETLATAREIVGTDVPALAFHSVGASYRHALFAPLAEGGIRDYQEAVDAYMMDPDEPRVEADRRYIMDAVSGVP